MKSNSRNILLIADVGYASPYWLDYVRILQNDFSWDVKVISPSMNRWQRKFFDVRKAQNVEVIETAKFSMFYRRFQGAPRAIRALVRISQKFGFLRSETNHQEWVSTAISEGVRLNEMWKVSFVVSTCLPFETHVIAANLAKIFDVPWLADYRDPYSFSHTRTTEPSVEAVNLERQTLLTAKACTTTSQGFAGAISKVYSGPIYVLHNGFDDLNPTPTVKARDEVSILYQGSIYPKFQNVLIILKALEELYEFNLEVEVKNTPIKIIFGGFSTHIVVNYFKKKGRDIPDWVEIKGVVDFQTAKRMQREADLLLLLNWEDENQPGVMQTKLYEYISSGKLVLSTGGTGKDETAKILFETGTAQYFSTPHELTKFFKEIIRSNFEIPYFPKYSEIEKYSRFNQAARLSKIIDELVQL